MVIYVIYSWFDSSVDQWNCYFYEIWHGLMSKKVQSLRSYRAYGVADLCLLSRHPDISQSCERRDPEPLYCLVCLFSPHLSLLLIILLALRDSEVIYRLAYGLIVVAGVELMLTQTHVRCPTLCHKAPRADGPIIYNGSVKQFQIVVDDILQIFNIFSLCKLLC